MCSHASELFMVLQIGMHGLECHSLCIVLCINCEKKLTLQSRMYNVEFNINIVYVVALVGGLD